MKIKILPAPSDTKGLRMEANLLRLKARYGDDWSIELTSFLGSIIHYWARNRNGEPCLNFKSQETIDLNDLRLLNEDRKQRGLSPIRDQGVWK